MNLDPNSKSKLVSMGVLFLTTRLLYYPLRNDWQLNTSLFSFAGSLLTISMKTGPISQVERTTLKSNHITL